MDENKVVPIYKNKEPGIDSPGFMIQLLENLPSFEKDVLKLHLGLEDIDVMYDNNEIALQLNQSEETVEIALKSGLKKFSNMLQKEKTKEENENAYREIRLQMHNKLIKKLHSLKEEWQLDNISQVTERIILAFFKNDLE
tara:strand:- start:60 stop:479 length:420 start_codon:yes stop_codon:yes gene_type:complete